MYNAGFIKALIKGVNKNNYGDCYYTIQRFGSKKQKSINFHPNNRPAKPLPQLKLDNLN
jgi:hypothetical protein